MSQAKLIINKQKLLLAEGKDDVAIFSMLLEQCGITDIQIESYDGKDKLSRFLTVLAKMPGYSDLDKLAITCDADTDNVEVATTNIKKATKQLGTVLDSATPIHIQDGPELKIYILPDNNSLGEMEDLAKLAVAGSERSNCVDAFFNCLEENANLAFEPGQQGKPWLYAWLSAHDNPTRGLGWSAGHGRIDTTHSAFDELRAFIQSI